MECPHCNQETDPTLVYCKVCGEQIELDPEAVHKALLRDAELDAIEIMEHQSRSAMYIAGFLLVCAFGLHFVLCREVRADASAGYFAPSKVVEGKDLDPQAALDLDPIAVDIPTEDARREEYVQKLKALK
jgi:hypothetical protein